MANVVTMAHASLPANDAAPLAAPVAQGTNVADTTAPLKATSAAVTEVLVGRVCTASFSTASAVAAKILAVNRPAAVVAMTPHLYLRSPIRQSQSRHSHSRQ